MGKHDLIDFYLVEFYLKIIVSIIFIGLLYWRYRMLRNLAIHSKMPSKQMIIRLSLILSLIVLQTTLILIGQFNDDSLLQHSKYQNVSWLLLIVVITYIGQVYILRREFLLKFPIMWFHKLFWVLIAVIQLPMMITVILDQSESILESLFIIIEAALILVLLIYSLIVSQDLQEFKEIGFFKMSIPTVSAKDLSENMLNQQKLVQLNLQLKDYSTGNNQDTENSQSTIENINNHNDSGKIYTESLIHFDSNWFQKSNNILQNQNKQSKLIEIKVKNNLKIMKSQVTENQFEYQVKLVIQSKFPNIQARKYEITKTIKDIIMLEKQMILEFENDNYLRDFINQIKVNLDCQLQNISDFIGINQNIEVLQNYMNTITNNPQFIINPLQDFLEFNDQEKIEIKNECMKSRTGSLAPQNQYTINLLNLNESIRLNSGNEENQQEQRQSSYLFQDINNSSVNYSQSIRISRPDNHQSQFLQSNYQQQQQKKKNLNVYAPIFNVKVLRYKKVQGQHYEFNIQITPSIKNSEKFLFVKRYKQILDFNDTLKDFLKIKMPPFPKKVLNLDTQQITERMQGIELYFSTLLNEEVYFCQTLFDFVNIEKQKVIEIKKQVLQENQKENSKEEDKDEIPDKYYQNCIIQVISESNKLLLNNNKPFTVYQIKLNYYDNQEDLNNQKIKYTRIIEKRYSEFSELHKGIEVFFQNHSKKEYLPELPPKYAFGKSKTSTHFREQALQQYFQKLVDIKLIFKSVWFRRFLDQQQVISFDKSTLLNNNNKNSKTPTNKDSKDSNLQVKNGNWIIQQIQNISSSNSSNSQLHSASIRSTTDQTLQTQNSSVNNKNNQGTFLNEETIQEVIFDDEEKSKISNTNEFSRPEALLQSLLYRSEEDKSRVNSLQIDNLDSKVNVNVIGRSQQYDVYQNQNYLDSRQSSINNLDQQNSNNNTNLSNSIISQNNVLDNPCMKPRQSIDEIRRSLNSNNSNNK